MPRSTLFILVLLLAPLAGAVSQPTLYFLKDGETGPIGHGILNGTAPSEADPSTRPILPETAAEWRLAEPPMEQILGPVIVALWLGPSVVAAGNLTAVLYSADGTTLTPLASASLDVATDPSETPDPTVLIPPDPTDPPGAAAHIVAQVLAMTLQPPLVLQMGPVNATVPAGHELSLGLFLESTDGTVAMGVATAQYDGMLNPSFLYVPWYTPDPPSTSSTSTSTTTTSTTTSTSTTGPAPVSSPPEGKQTPAPIIGIALVLVALAVRRRL